MNHAEHGISLSSVRQVSILAAHAYEPRATLIHHL
jgi:hypothetical protein